MVTVGGCRPEQKGGVVGSSSTRPTAEHTPAPVVGRRERKKQDTHRRIFEAADELFFRKGYSAVTTQEVAEAADIGAGTLFRYAQTKAELLIMVMNDRLRIGTERGAVIAEQGGSPAEAIVGLVEPLFQAALNQPENTTVYQREVLFGVEGPYRTEALGRIAELEEAMADVLGRYAGSHATHPAADIRRAAGTIFSVLYLKLVRLELGRVSPESLPEVLHSDVDYLVSELLGVR
jgi:TetR/AcrR family transcriptional regulator, cholesterol catabolism regulator